MDTYLIMKQHQSAPRNPFPDQVPHLVVFSLREAKNRVKILKENSKTCFYSYTKVKNTSE